MCYWHLIPFHSPKFSLGKFLCFPFTRVASCFFLGGLMLATPSTHRAHSCVQWEKGLFSLLVWAMLLFCIILCSCAGTMTPWHRNVFLCCHMAQHCMRMLKCHLKGLPLWSMRRGRAYPACSMEVGPAQHAKDKMPKFLWSQGGSSIAPFVF